MPKSNNLKRQDQPRPETARQRLLELGGDERIFSKAQRRKFSAAEVIAALDASAAIKSAAARKLGCNRETIDAYVAEYPEIQKALVRIREEFKDHVENRLYKAIANDNLTAILFWLKTQAKDRGYSERTELVTPPGRPLQVDDSQKLKPIDFMTLEPDERRLLLVLMNRAQFVKCPYDDELVARGVLGPFRPKPA